jgi:hypothetical protein
MVSGGEKHEVFHTVVTLVVVPVVDLRSARYRSDFAQIHPSMQ